jgi:hypothetical protein
MFCIYYSASYVLAKKRSASYVRLVPEAGGSARPGGATTSAPSTTACPGCGPAGGRATACPERVVVPTLEPSRALRPRWS